MVVKLTIPEHPVVAAAGSPRSPHGSPRQRSARQLTPRQKSHTQFPGQPAGKGAPDAGAGEASTFDDSKYNPRALFLFKTSNPFRRALIRFVEWKWFDRFILLLIFFNCGFLAAFNPLDTPELNPTQPTKRDVLEMAATVFTACFLFEFLCKLIAMGFVLGPGAYLKSAWNWLDFIIVIIGVLDFDFLPGTASGNLSAIRTFRVMRPLRAITRFKELRFLVLLLLQCIPMLVNVIGLCFFIFFVFGILGLQLFAGALRQRCYSETTGLLWNSDYLCSASAHPCPSGYACLPLHENPNFGATHFDNIGGSILTLFQVMTYEGWTTTMYMLQDTTSFWVVIYFIVVIFVGPIFTIQLFLVVISNKFAETKAALSALTGHGSRNDNSALARARRKEKERRQSKKDEEDDRIRHSFGACVRVPLYLLAKSKFLKHGVTAVIIINTIFMASVHDCDVRDVGSYCKDFNMTLECFNIAFTCIFSVEMVIKLIGLGPKAYFSSAYNAFDFLIVFVGLFELSGVVQLVQCLHGSSGAAARLCEEYGGTGLSVLRTFRLVRLAKLLNSFPALQRQFKVVAASMSSVASLMVLLLLFLLIFAVLGMNVFGGKVWVPPSGDLNLGTRVVFAHQGDNSLLIFGHVHDIQVGGALGALYLLKLEFPLGDGTSYVWADLNEHAPFDLIVGVIPRSNFDSLLTAFVTVFQILTQEDWNEVMYATQLQNGLASSLYFVTLIVVGNYMLFNLFVAIIIQGFADNKQQLSQQDLDAQDEAALMDNGEDGSYSPRTKGVTKVFTRMKATLGGIRRKGAVAPEGEEERITPGMVNRRLSGQEDIMTPGALTLLDKEMELPPPARTTSGGELQRRPSITTGSELHRRPSATTNGSNNNSDDALSRRRSSIDVDLPRKTSANGEMGLPLSVLTRRSTATNDLQRALSVSNVYSEDGSSDGNGGEGRPRMQIDVGDGNRSPLPGIDLGDPTTPAFSEHGETPLENEDEDHHNWEEVWGDHEELTGRSFFCLGPDSLIRWILALLVREPRFEQFILLCILLSSIALAMDRPALVDGPERVFMDWLNLALSVAFGIEALLKITVYSFSVYIKSSWNRLDFFIVATSALDLMLSYLETGSDLSILKILRIFRIFRALRPLRVISRASGLKIVVQTITGSVKPILNTVVIALMVFMVFGILGVQLFAGKLWHCSDPLYHTQSECEERGGKMDDGTPREWVNAAVPFDHIGQAMLAMMLLASQDNWPEIMWTGVDSTGRGTGRIQGNQPAMILFFFSFILIGGFFVLNIFVGVFVDNYNAAAKTVAETAVKVPPRRKEPEVWPPPRSRTQAIMMFVVTHTAFDLGIALCIALNVGTMAFESYHQSLWQTQFLVISNYMFTNVFGLECVMKLIAFLPKRYFADGWNKFDFTIVMISFMGVAIEESGATIALNPTILRVLRVFRIFRILRAFRIFKAAKGLQTIVDSLRKSLPAVGNLAGVLFLLFFIFGILAVEIFGQLCVTNDSGELVSDMRCRLLADSVKLDSHASFANLGVSLLSLFRICTNDNWAQIMRSCNLSPGPRTEDALAQAKVALAAEDYEQIHLILPGCVTESELLDLGVRCPGSKACASTCGSDISPLFFSSFVCMGTFVLLNLVIAVLMEQLSAVEQEADRDEMVSDTLGKRVFLRIYWRWKNNAHKRRELYGKRRKQAAKGGQSRLRRLTAANIMARQRSSSVLSPTTTSGGFRSPAALFKIAGSFRSMSVSKGLESGAASLGSTDSQKQVPDAIGEEEPDPSRAPSASPAPAPAAASGGASPAPPCASPGPTSPAPPS